VFLLQEAGALAVVVGGAGESVVVARADLKTNPNPGVAGTHLGAMVVGGAMGYAESRRSSRSVLANVLIPAILAGFTGLQTALRVNEIEAHRTGTILVPLTGLGAVAAWKKGLRFRKAPAAGADVVRITGPSQRKGTTGDRLVLAVPAVTAVDGTGIFVIALGVLGTTLTDVFFIVAGSDVTVFVGQTLHAQVLVLETAGFSGVGTVLLGLAAILLLDV
jgi:hypothetical protein